MAAAAPGGEWSGRMGGGRGGGGLWYWGPGSDAISCRGVGGVEGWFTARAVVVVVVDHCTGKKQAHSAKKDVPTSDTIM